MRAHGWKKNAWTKRKPTKLCVCFVGKATICYRIHRCPRIFDEIILGAYAMREKYIVSKLIARMLPKKNPPSQTHTAQNYMLMLRIQFDSQWLWARAGGDTRFAAVRREKVTSKKELIPKANDGFNEEEKRRRQKTSEKKDEEPGIHQQINEELWRVCVEFRCRCFLRWHKEERCQKHKNAI